MKTNAQVYFSPGPDTSIIIDMFALVLLLLSLSICSYIYFASSVSFRANDKEVVFPSRFKEIEISVCLCLCVLFSTNVLEISLLLQLIVFISSNFLYQINFLTFTYSYTHIHTCKRVYYVYVLLFLLCGSIYLTLTLKKIVTVSRFRVSTYNEKNDAPTENSEIKGSTKKAFKPIQRILNGESER